MKVRFAVALVGSALGFVLPAFADEAPTAASSTQDAVSVDSDGPTGHPAIKDHHPKRPKKQHPKPSDEASSKSAPGPSSASDGKGDAPLSDSSAANAANSATELTTVQPVLYYNFQQGWYFRSDAVMQFNLPRPHDCHPGWDRLRQGVPAVWRLPV